jgi:hypothetical protein
VFQAQEPKGGGTAKYSVSLIIPKSDTETIKKINDAIEQAKQENKDVWGGTIPKGLKGGLRDGDEERDDPAYANSYFINANSAQKPGVVDQDLNAILDPAEFYSGCYGRASVSFFAYNSSGSKGVGCGLNNVQKLEDGERLGGGTSAAQDFAI